MRGLPASGKSTKAKELAEEIGNAVRVNRDLLRTMIHFGTWSGKNERFIKMAERAIASMFLDENLVVIVDDTNLHPGTVESWKQFAKENKHEFEIFNVDTDYIECIDRDSLREDSVGRNVIVKMARQYGMYPFDKREIICDIDGTLCNIDHRLHYVRGEQKDWDSFFHAMKDDEPRPEIIDILCDKAAEGYRILLVSGRPEEYRGLTQRWLFNFGVPYTDLFMRPKGDHRPDTEIKQEILDRYFKKELIDLVIDDRPSVIRMWRENGLEVMDVGNGVEF